MKDLKTLTEKIAEIKSKGLTPSHETKMIAIITKKHNKGSNTGNKKWSERINVDNAKPVAKWEGLTIAEINRMNAEENLPSSMR